MNFTTFKDRAWRGYDWSVRMLFRLPTPIVRAGLTSFASILWIGWLLPDGKIRRTFRALSARSGDGSPAGIYRRFISGFALTLYRFERLRQGNTAEFGAILDIPEDQRLQEILSRGGVMLMMPHVHGSLGMAEALAQRYPLTFVVRSAKDDGRAAHQMKYYAHMSCDVLDVRRTDDVAVTRGIIRALRQGRIVLAAGDLVKKAPAETFDARKDLVRVDAFGQPVGALGWPARFAKKAGVPVVPVMVVQREDRLTLLLGDPIDEADLQENTQAWMSGMLDLVCQHPADWTFVLDKQWMKLLGNAEETTGKEP